MEVVELGEFPSVGKAKVWQKLMRGRRLKCRRTRGDDGTRN